MLRSVQKKAKNIEIKGFPDPSKYGKSIRDTTGLKPSKQKVYLSSHAEGDHSWGTPPP
jgi:hypothetical protein